MHECRPWETLDEKGISRRLEGRIGRVSASNGCAWAGRREEVWLSLMGADALMHSVFGGQRPGRQCRIACLVVKQAPRNGIGRKVQREDVRDVQTVARARGKTMMMMLI
jgi:hypothetical protein